MIRIYEDVTSQLEVKKSRFITYLHRSTDEEDAREFIKIIKKRHPDATHHCTAMVIGQTARSNDDGEPAGTAGRPMLDILLKNGLNDITAVVVRYFGGTLLGKGGLVRAYSKSVQLALEQAVFTESKNLGLYMCDIEYSEMNKMDSLIKTDHLSLVDQSFGEQVCYTIGCPPDYDIRSEIARITAGKSQPVFLETSIQEAVIEHQIS